MAARNASITVESQNFLTEAINKERDTRLNWHQKRRGQDAVKPRQMEVFRRNIEERSKPSEALMERLPAITKEQRFNKKKTTDWDALVTKSASGNVNTVLNMRPATPDTNSKLYDGFTKEGKGRYQYLQSRYFQIPEEKFPYPLLNSWEYGWRLNDVVKKEEIKKPTYGRTRIVADTFYTRTGAI
ncbi:hypothetical protein LOTGIDRAFT_203814 [Lottia gigantea]|uniref:Sperm microtubule inner protein 1 C-terminal domain-containing protein n=1 Tax=Lottia gigantea TaxID=225164 RepID=V4ALP3_LOTGI|nr:hypothetical protein LOTGIDRAFT_203814 [Lottia gigantea]ESO95680.1 hypothetical protein LOTGIDRAFT_203814 [Lottia gigantea]